MSELEHDGTFQAEILDAGVTKTRKQGLPQLVATFKILNKYEAATDPENPWQDWTKYDQSIKGYFVLVTRDKTGAVVKCMNYDQVIAATGWDGASFSGLAALDLTGKIVQIRTEFDEYDGKTTLKVVWIDEPEAQPGVKKMTPQEAQALDAEFAIAGQAKAASPAKAPAAKKAAPKTAKKSTPKAAPNSMAAANEAAQTAETATGTAPPTPPVPPVPEPPTAAVEVEVEEIDGTVAWDEINKVNSEQEKPVPGKVVENYWTEAVVDIAENPEAPTPHEYGHIRLRVLEAIGIPF